MSREMKVFASSVGFNEVVVAATTKKAAREAMGFSVGEFNNYANETGNDYQIKVAMSEPGTPFIRSNNYSVQTNGWWRGPRWDRPWDKGEAPDIIIERNERLGGVDGHTP